jgi:mannose-1-phosphate guanylyltransferase
VQAAPHVIILLGMVLTAAEVQYGWIERGAALRPWPRSRRIYRVRHFYEKPAAVCAAQLYAHGGLWNSFVVVANPVTLLVLCCRALPRIYRSFNAIWPTFGTPLES